METLEHPDGPRFPYTALTGEYVCCKRVEDYVYAGDKAMFGLGSHYHCPRCWVQTGSYGHTSTFCHKINKPFPKNTTEFHRCCPDGYCELEDENSPRVKR